MLDIARIPYCGLPPAPPELWQRWNFDPFLISCLIVIAAIYAAATVPAWSQGRSESISPTESAAFYSGWAITAAALISPLCPLSVSLFSARVGQHIILTMIAAPLIALGRPAQAVALWRNRRNSLNRTAASEAWLSTALFAALLWFWHGPAAYRATFASTFVYWAMHISMIGSALWLWAPF